MSKQNENCEDKHSHKVKVTLDGNKLKIDQGTYKVNDLKISLGVSSDYELEIVEDGEFKPLPDSSEITICGHEEFIAHVKSGGSSQ